MAGRVRVPEWLSFILGLSLTASGAATAFYAPPLTYQATSQIMIVLPATGRSARVLNNPFLYQPNGLVDLLRSSILYPRSPEFRQSMEEAGFTSKFELDAEILTPVVRFSAEGPDPRNVDATMAEFRRRFDGLVTQTQVEVGVPGRQLARVLEIQSIPAAPITGDRARAAGAVGLVGIVLTMVVISCVGGRARRSPTLARASTR